MSLPAADKVEIHELVARYNRAGESTTFPEVRAVSRESGYYFLYWNVFGSGPLAKLEQ